MKLFFLTALVMAGLYASAVQQPNVVVILADDMGWGDVGYHGFKDIQTPNIDKLAKSGTWFEQGYVTASVCGPSRAGLISGVYQQRFGFLGNTEGSIIPLDQPTLAERMKVHGYRTGMIGKWHVGHEKDELPNARGFDFYYGSLTGSHDYFRSGTDPHGKQRALLPIFRNGQVEPPIEERGGYLTDLYTKEAVDFIERSRDDPFFLYVAHNAVHYPWQADKKDIKRLKDLKVHHEERRHFAAMVLALDDSVGRIVKCLEKNGLERDTLVVFLSDNGTPRGQGFKAPKQKTRGQTTMSSPGSFNGFKGDTYEGGIRVPFVMAWPGAIPAGKAYPYPVSSLDIVATAVANSGGIQLKNGLEIDGVDLIPFLAGEQVGRPHDWLYWRRGEDYAIRKGDWKLAYNDQNGPKTIRFFNLADDSGEWKDVVSNYPERAQAMQDLFDAWDGGLPGNMDGKNPKNRNGGYANGKRVKVDEFNAKH